MALASLVEESWAGGRYRECLAWCERLLEVEPDEELVHSRVLDCYTRLGEPLAGMLHYRRYARELAEQDGAPPARLAEAFRRLEDALRPAS
jgi:DNA-binding SARP family transcriptional activator